jgi:hypothetical protein
MYGLLPRTHNEFLTLGYTDLSHISKMDESRIYRAFTHEGQGVLMKTPASVPLLVQLHGPELAQVHEYSAHSLTWVSK